MTLIETFGFLPTLLLLIPLAGIAAWCGFWLMHWVANSEAPFKRAALIIVAIILLAKLATPAAAGDRLDEIADELIVLEINEWQHGMNLLLDMYRFYDYDEASMRTIINDLSVQTDAVPVKLYRIIQWCLWKAQQTGTMGALGWMEVDGLAAVTFQIQRGGY